MEILFEHANARGGFFAQSKDYFSGLIQINSSPLSSGYRAWVGIDRDIFV